MLEFVFLQQHPNFLENFQCILWLLDLNPSQVSTIEVILTQQELLLPVGTCLPTAMDYVFGNLLQLRVQLLQVLFLNQLTLYVLLFICSFLLLVVLEMFVEVLNGFVPSLINGSDALPLSLLEISSLDLA